MPHDEQLTVEKVDHALSVADAKGLTVDEKAMLWAIKARLVGVAFRIEHLRIVLGLTESEALDVVARLEEQGYMDGA